MADDTAELLRQLKIERADFFGDSMGGGIALELAMHHPDLVGKLVWAGGASYSPDGLYPVIRDGARDLKPELLAGSPWQKAYVSIAPDPTNWSTLVLKIRDLDVHFGGWKSAIEEEQESQRRVEYMGQQVLALIQEVVDELNAQLVETNITRRDGYRERVYEFQGRELVIYFFSPNELYINPEVPGRMETLKKRNVVHGGFIEVRTHGEDHEGWNLVLVRPADDLYGEWRIVETRLSPLSGKMSRYEPIATEARTFADNLACHWMPAMHVFQLTDKVLEKADIVRILGVFIPKI